MSKLMTKSVKEKIQKYNSELDNIIAVLTALKLDETAESFDVRQLQRKKFEFAILTSVKNRHKVENAFEDFYNEYGYELQKICEENM